MSADVDKNRSQLARKRVEFLERVEYYINKRAYWTPAEGVLLVTGVIPPLGKCTEIPGEDSDVRQLDDPDVPATPRQLQFATRLLDEYREDVRHGTMPRDEIVSDDFLKWCNATGEASWNVPKLLEFMRHIYPAGSYHHHFALSVADELAALKLLAAAGEEQKKQSTSQEEVVMHPASNHGRRVSLLGKKRQRDLDHLIAEAIIAAASDATKQVWLKLKDMAHAEIPPFTGRVETYQTKKATVHGLIYKTNVVQKDGTMMGHLTEGALDARLRRLRAKQKVNS
ncbi:hypothetical protein AB4851_28795 [Burkholderia sp. 22PA0099]|uniref:hypothetical protein n=1 Tax=Burkholderia sp. 22PA0099 TaxID=3237372 RepID=UPI0039C1ACC6